MENLRELSPFHCKTTKTRSNIKLFCYFRFHPTIRWSQLHGKSLALIFGKLRLMIFKQHRVRSRFSYDFNFSHRGWTKYTSSTFLAHFAVASLFPRYRTLPAREFENDSLHLPQAGTEKYNTAPHQHGSTSESAVLTHLWIVVNSFKQHSLIFNNHSSFPHLLNCFHRLSG